MMRKLAILGKDSLARAVVVAAASFLCNNQEVKRSCLLRAMLPH
jgi:hypothetical protein